MTREDETDLLARTNLAIDECLAIILDGNYTINQALWIAGRVEALVKSVERRAAGPLSFEKFLRPEIDARRALAKDIGRDEDLKHAHLSAVLALRLDEQIRKFEADARMDEQQ